jgi:hypothetical protein
MIPLSKGMAEIIRRKVSTMEMLPESQFRSNVSKREYSHDDE